MADVRKYIVVLLVYICITLYLVWTGKFAEEGRGSYVHVSVTAQSALLVVLWFFRCYDVHYDDNDVHKLILLLLFDVCGSVG